MKDNKKKDVTIDSVDEPNIGCMILSIGEEFKKLAACAKASFEKFHPDVTLHFVDESNIDSFEINKHVSEEIRNHIGIFRFGIAAEIMGKHKYDKFIILGSDTITCARLDEFIDNNHDMLLTSCYPYQLAMPYVFGPLDLDTFSAKNEDGEYKHLQYLYTPLLCYVVDTDTDQVEAQSFTFENVYDFKRIAELFSATFKGKRLVHVSHMYANADVLCFNSFSALKDVFKYSLKHWNDWHNSLGIAAKFKELGFDFYADQAALNMVSTISIARRHNYSLRMFESKKEWPSYSVYFVDLPYQIAKHTYNVRAKKSLKESRALGSRLTKQIETNVESGKSRGHKPLDFDYAQHPLALDRETGRSVGEYFVKDKKLFTVDGKQIKVWHYLCGLGLKTKACKLGKVNKIIQKDYEEPSAASIKSSQEEFCDIIDSFIFDVFNQETKKFFKEECACGNFFEEKYNI